MKTASDDPKTTAETVTVKREDVVTLYALVRRCDHADSYTTDDLIADFNAVRSIGRRMYQEACNG